MPSKIRVFRGFQLYQLKPGTFAPFWGWRGLVLGYPLFWGLWGGPIWGQTVGVIRLFCLWAKNPRKMCLIISLFWAIWLKMHLYSPKTGFTEKYSGKLRKMADFGSILSQNAVFWGNNRGFAFSLVAANYASNPAPSSIKYYCILRFSLYFILTNNGIFMLFTL